MPAPPAPEVAPAQEAEWVDEVPGVLLEQEPAEQEPAGPRELAPAQDAALDRAPKPLEAALAAPEDDEPAWLRQLSLGGRTPERPAPAQEARSPSRPQPLLPVPAEERVAFRVPQCGQHACFISKNPLDSSSGVNHVC